MKKILTVALILTIMGMVVPAAHAGNTRYFNGTIFTGQVTVPATSSAAAVSGKAAFYSIFITTDGSNDITLTVYDNTAGSGTVLVQTVTILGSALTWTFTADPPLPAAIGIYVSMSVAGAGTGSFQVLYDN